MFRLRRAAVTLTLGAGVVSGAVGVGVAGFSGVANAVTAGSIAAATTPTINATGSNQAAGNLTVTLPTTAIGATEYVDLLVTANAASAVGSGTICYNGTPSFTSNGVTVSAIAVAGPQAGTACPAGSSGDILQLTVPAQTPTSPGTITISGIAYNTASASGTLQVFGWTDSAAGDLTNPPATQTGQLVPYPTSNGTLPAAPPTTPAFGTMVMTSPVLPSIGLGGTNQAAGNWAETVTAVGSTSGWVSGDQIAIEIKDHGGIGCSGTDYVYFSSAPTATVTTTGFGSTAAPTLGTPTLGYDAAAGCSPNLPNVVLIPFSNGGTMPSGSTFTISVAGVNYTVGSAATTGTVTVSGTYETGGASPSTITAFQPASNASPPSNASVAALYLTANNPAVVVGKSTNGNAISPVNIVEATAGQIAPGYVCLTLPAGDTFNTASVPTVKVASGNATVSTSAPTFQASNSGAGPANDTVVFQVTGSSTTGNPSTITVSGLSVNAGTTTGAQVIFAGTAASPTTCPAAGAGTIGSATAFTVGQPTQQIFGATADGTAAAELEAQYSYSTGNCPGTSNSYRPVVLATDQNYPDALAGAYLASYLKTGELITPTASLSSDALNAIRNEGITNVYVVGGPLAVSNADISQLEATQAYTCGGTAPQVMASGSPLDLQVTQIYGQTLYDTAQDIAQYPGSAQVNAVTGGGLNLSAAYAGTNSSGGNGMYNDTSGNASTAPAKSGALRTAILATSQGWQDAMAAGALSYATDTPILITDPSTLSSQVSAAIANLGIQQVIVMGGPVAVSNAVVTSLQGMGESVLRVAGQDYTDTAVQLANLETSATTDAGLGWTPATVVVTRGDYFSDGLAGATIAGNNKQPMLETFDPNTVGQYLTGFLQTAGTVGPSHNGHAVGSLTILGGPQAITPTTIATMQGDL